MARTGGFVVVTDRGGHLHNARMLLSQLRVAPTAILTTPGPELARLGEEARQVFSIPYLFSWIGKRRVFNPFKTFYAFAVALVLAIRLRPDQVISLGASDVVPFCFWTRLMGARILHVECMNQVVTPSVTGKLLYPLCHALYVQWPELLGSYGPKARYAGWVLGTPRA